MALVHRLVSKRCGPVDDRRELRAKITSDSKSSHAHAAAVETTSGHRSHHGARSAVKPPWSLAKRGNAKKKDCTRTKHANHN